MDACQTVGQQLRSETDDIYKYKLPYISHKTPFRTVIPQLGYETNCNYKYRVQQANFLF
jgi:hypothetical protein